MLYYYNRDGRFQKESNKIYKTDKGALDKLAKEGQGAVYDETGKLISELVGQEDVPEGALEAKEDGSVPGYDENGVQTGLVDAEVVADAIGEAETDDVNADMEDSDTDKEISMEHPEHEADTSIESSTLMRVETTTDSLYVRAKPDCNARAVGYINESEAFKRTYEVSQVVDGWGLVLELDGWIALAYTRAV